MKAAESVGREGGARGRRGPGIVHGSGTRALGPEPSLQQVSLIHAAVSFSFFPYLTSCFVLGLF